MPSEQSGLSPSPAVERDHWMERAARRRPGHVEQFPAIVQALASSADFSDARYWVARAISSASSGRAMLSGKADAVPGLARTLVATNLAELGEQTHLLPAGTLVQVFAIPARGGASGSTTLYAFSRAPVIDVVVKIGGAAGDGAYDATILGGMAVASATSALTMPMGMSAPSAVNALALNLEEDAQSGHRLANGSYAVGVVRGWTSESPPRRIVLIRGAAGRTDSPTTLGSTSLGTESPDTAAWSKSANATPLDLFMLSRVVYNASGDQVLYGFVRKLSFDARGVLSSVSAETRISIDATESCP